MGLITRIKTGWKRTVNGIKEIGNRIMQGVTYVSGKAMYMVGNAAILLHWDEIAEASQELCDALQESHDLWKDRADRLQYGRLVGENTKPNKFAPDRKLRSVAESAIQTIEDHCKADKNLDETLALLTPEERLEFIQDICDDFAKRNGLMLEPVTFFLSDTLEFGNFSPSENRIKLNASLVTSDNIYLVKEQIYTVIHETMHAIQYLAIEQEKLKPGSSGYDPQLVCDWANNFLHYIRPEVDFESYRNQPLERAPFGIEWILKNHFND